MKIGFQAFCWDCRSQEFGLESFLDELSKINEEKYKERILYIFKDKKYWAGLVLTIKNIKKFVTLVKSKQEIKLDVHKLDENEKIADFNFFIFRSKYRIWFVSILSSFLFS